MRSRAARFVLLLVAVAALGAAGYEAWDLERQATADRVAAESFDRLARQAEATIAELRGAQQAYVADGQGSDFWFRKVRALLDALTSRLAELRQAARTPESSTALEAATEAVSGFTQMDQRARDLVGQGQRLSASDVIFSEGVEITTRAASRVDAARVAEAATFSANATRLQWMQVYVTGGAAGVTLLVLLLLVPLPSARQEPAIEDEAAPHRGLGLSGGPTSSPAASEEAALASPAQDPAESDATLPNGADLIRLDSISLNGRAREVDLTGAARVCAALARVQDTPDLPPLLAQAATVLDAAGLIVWITDGPGGALRPALAHGYAPQVLARMGAIPLAADNATAAAVRTGELQAVPGDDLANGALVVPLQTAGGVTGAVAVEVRHGRENDQDTRALASIIASQLATLFTPAEDEAPPREAHP